MSETPNNHTRDDADSRRTSARPNLDWDRLRGRAIQIMGLVAIGALLTVLFQAATNHKGGESLDRFDRASLALLEFIPNPPEQPTASFTKADGSPATLQDFRGKTVLVNLWATWCAPCVEEMPTLAELQRTYADQDFVVVAISVDKAETRDDAIAQLQELGGGALTFYHDVAMDVVFPIKARGFPTSVLYGPDGKEIARLAGEADWASPEAKGLIAAVLAGER